MASFLRLEKCLLPSPEIINWNDGDLTIKTLSTREKVAYYVSNIIKFTGLVAILPLTLPYDYFTAREVVPLAPKEPDIKPECWPPKEMGFACSLFQSSGLGTKWSATPGLRGKCDWDKWMDKPGHVEHRKPMKDFFIDILSDPTNYIEMLKSHNVTTHRFSLEWSVIMPEDGRVDDRAVGLYRVFIGKLLEAGITPSVTLNHFTVPEWFYESGNFQNLENIDKYLEYATKAIELFPEVNDWWSFNELGVKAFQQSREVYPTDFPEGSSSRTRIHGAGIATRNMLIAHCKLHKFVSENHPDKKLGVTHQWLQMDMASGNYLERMVKYFFEKVGFTPVYQFFKNGRYSFEFPFMANIQFQIPEEEFNAKNKFLMRLGVQAYPLAMIKMGLSRGNTYPGRPQELTNTMGCAFGGTCEPGGTLMSFGPRQQAKRIQDILEEAFAITDDVSITEFGSDATVWKWGDSQFRQDDASQARFLRELVENVRAFSERTFKRLHAIHCWSDLRGTLEWDRGDGPELPIIEPQVDEDRRLTGWRSTPASRYLASVYAGEVEEEEEKDGAA